MLGGFEWDDVALWRTLALVAGDVLYNHLSSINTKPHITTTLHCAKEGQVVKPIVILGRWQSHVWYNKIYVVVLLSLF